MFFSLITPPARKNITIIYFFYNKVNDLVDFLGNLFYNLLAKFIAKKYFFEYN